MSAQYVVLRDATPALVLAREESFPTPFAIGGGPRGEKGDPGGNIMAIGLFTDAGGLSIPVGTDAVRTSGHSITGLGIADYVADAAVGSAYVTAHPHTSFISTNGRGFRLDVSKGIDLFQVGGIADSPAPGVGSDNYPAVLAATTALGRGGTLVVPNGGDYFFRCSQLPPFTNGICIFGEGFSENPGIVNGVHYSIPRNYSGSVICLDPDVPGPVFSAFTDNNADSYAYEFQSANYSVCRDVMFLGGGGTGTIAHGIDIYVPVHFQNVRIYGFAGNGINLNCNTVGSSRYGNADLSQFYGVISEQNKGHGVILDGNNSNIITFLGCNFNNNGGCGSLDTTVIGNNLFLGCHYSVNNRSYGTPSGFSAAQRAKVVGDAPCLSDQYTGSAVQYRVRDYSGSDIGNESSYVATYIESGLGSKARLRSPTKVDRGFLSEIGFWHGEFTAQADAADSLINYSNIIGGSGPLKISNDIVRITDRAQANIFAEFSATGLALNAGNILSIGGYQVVGPPQPAIATDVSGAPNQATVNAILNALRGHGLIG